MVKHWITFGIVVAAAVVVAGLIFLAKLAGPSQETQTTFNNLLSATLAADADAFSAECNDEMKASISKPVLENLSKQIEPRAKSGYETKYLGALKKQAYDVYIWRLRFKDGGDDLLATLSMKDGKAGGFYIR